MKELLFATLFIYMMLTSAGQNIVRRFNSICNEEQTAAFINDFSDQIPEYWFGHKNSSRDTASADSAFFRLHPGDTITRGKYLCKVTFTESYSSCNIERFMLPYNISQEEQADSILKSVISKFNNGESFSKIACSYDKDYDPEPINVWYSYTKNYYPIQRTIMQYRNGDIFVVPSYYGNNSFYIIHKISDNDTIHTCNLFRVYKSDFNEWQPNTSTIYREFGETGQIENIVRKDVLGNKTIYTRYSFPYKRISQEVLTTKILNKIYYSPGYNMGQVFEGEYNGESKTITYEFNSCSDTSKIRNTKNPERFFKMNKPDKIPFKNYKTLIFHLRNDTLLREDHSNESFNPYFEIFRYNDSLITVYDYSLSLDTISVEKSFLIHFSDNGKRLKSHWVGTNDFDKSSYKSSPTTQQFFKDSIKYSEIEFHYNNEHYWLRLLDMIRIEGPVYINVIHEIDTKLFSKIQTRNSDSIYTTELKMDKSGRIIEILYKENDIVYRRREIEY